MIQLDFKKDGNGLLPAIVQDAVSGDVLMLAYINQQSWKKPLRLARLISGVDPGSNYGLKVKLPVMFN